MSKPYAKAGEQVTCENGHPICTIATDIYQGQMFDPASLRDWVQKTPIIGTSFDMLACVHCGAAWVRSNYIMHFADGWRSYD